MHVREEADPAKNLLPLSANINDEANNYQIKSVYEVQLQVEFVNYP